MKTSNSGIFTKLRSNYLMSNPSIKGYSSGFLQINEQANSLQFELDRRRDIIMKLRSELLNKKNEISILKVQKNKKDGEYQRILRTLEEILKQSDQSTVAGFKAVESYLCSNFEIKNNKKEERFNEIKKMIHLNDEQKASLKEIIYVDTLKKQINILTGELNEKEKTISLIKKNNNNTNYVKMQNSFIQNFNELNQMKKQNEIIKKRMEATTGMLIAEKEDNINLKNNLQELQQKFRDFKEELSKRTSSLVKYLKKAKEKERNCRIFHIKKNLIDNSKTFDASKKLNNSNNLVNNEENSKSLSENDIKLIEAKAEMKKLSNNLNEIKRQINNKNKEMKILKNNKKELNNRIKNLSNDNNKYLNQINSLNKQIQDFSKINNNLEKENNDMKQKIEDIESKYEEEKLNYTGLKDVMAEKDKEIDDLKQMIESIKNKNNDDLFFTGIGAIGKKKDEIVETDNIAEELAQIEKKYAKPNQ